MPTDATQIGELVFVPVARLVSRNLDMHSCCFQWSPGSFTALSSPYLCEDHASVRERATNEGRRTARYNPMESKAPPSKSDRSFKCSSGDRGATIEDATASERGRIIMGRHGP